MKDVPEPEAVSEEENGEAPPATVSMPATLAPKFAPAKVDTTFDVVDATDQMGRPWKLLVCSTPMGVAWYYMDQTVAEKLAEWLRGTPPGPASGLIIPGVNVRPDMFKPGG